MQRLKDNGVELLVEPKPTNYWMRNKKPALDFLQDTPFAADRQLEDQKSLSELNRNPRLHDFTKMDKLRSVQIAQTKGNSRSVAIKANVINKVVREASGIHNYTIVPPPRIDDAKSIAGKQLLEPETNPSVRAYAQEAKSKPIICSFGHRPRSASRTFHPATMKFRLKHGQILPSVKDGKTGVGLPVAVLKKVLHAPKLYHDIAGVIEGGHGGNMESPSSSQGKRMQQTSSAPGLMEGHRTNSSMNLRNDLFLSKDEEDELFAPNNRSGKQRRLAPLDSESKGSWISSIEQKDRKKREPPKPDRPDWDDGFQRIQIKAKDRFELKKSLLNPKSDKPLSELLHRFDSMTVAENQPTIFCSEKQELDKMARSGQSLAIPKAQPLRGRPLYSDPWDIQMQQVKMLRKLEEEEKQERQEAKAFQEKLKSIPKVKYYPTTILKQMQEKNAQSQSLSPTKEVNESTLENSDEELAATTAKDEASETVTKQIGSSTTMEELYSKYPHWAYTEQEMNLALLLAKKGDRRALYDFHIGASTGRALPSAWRNDNTKGTESSGLSDFPEWNQQMTSQSAISALSENDYSGGGEEHDYGDSNYYANYQQQAQEEEEEEQDDRATVTFAELVKQQQQMARDLDQERLLDDNTIE